MKAMILAAGLGKRMRPLTDHTPKPLLQVAGHYLIEFHLKSLARAGIKEVVINSHWLAEQLPKALGSGSRWGLQLHYSYEPVLLETAGGIIAALPNLSAGTEPFLVVNGDVYTELDLAAWLAQAPALQGERLAYLGMVDNPEHHPAGDFCVDPVNGLLSLFADTDHLHTKTYSGIALFHPNFFAGIAPGPRPLGPLLKQQIRAGHVVGAVLSAYWLDVGTPERFAALQKRLG